MQGLWTGATLGRVLASQGGLLQRLGGLAGHEVEALRTPVQVEGRHGRTVTHTINAVRIRATGTGEGDGGLGSPGGGELPGVREEVPLVLLHGFGAGLGLFFPNVRGLADRFRTVYLVDWLGMGGSDRPRCWRAPGLPTLSFCRSSLGDEGETTERNVRWFTDPLGSFCDAHDLSRIHLAGHSLGGYLCGKYALDSPGRIASLTLVSPVGLAEHPSPAAVVSAASMPLPFRLLDAAWSSNFTPQQLIRAMGRRGQPVVQRVLERRFGSRWDAEEAALVAAYVHGISALPGSGEYAMNSLLLPILSSASAGGGEGGGEGGGAGGAEGSRQPGSVSAAVFAREPLAAGLGRAVEGGLPTLVLFGDDDWMLNDHVRRSVAAHGLDSALSVVPGAGHHVHMDNPPAFHRALAAHVAGRW